MGQLSYRELTAPAIEPVTLDQAKKQVNRDSSFTDDDALLTGLIVAARQYCEKQMQRSIFERSAQMNLDYFPFSDFSSTVNPNDRHCLYGAYWHKIAIKLPKPRCVSVQSITYLDFNAAVQTLDPSAYYVDTNQEPALIVPKLGTYWPVNLSYLPGSVTVTYTSGTYGDGVTTDNCPETIKQAMKLLISYWYNRRDAAESNPPKAIEFSVEALLAGERFETFGLVA